MTPGLNKEADQLLSKFKWGPGFYTLNKALFKVYVKCTDSSSVTLAQDLFLETVAERQRVERGLMDRPVRRMVNQGEGDEEEGCHGQEDYWQENRNHIDWDESSEEEDSEEEHDDAVETMTIATAQTCLDSLDQVQ